MKTETRRRLTLIGHENGTAESTINGRRNKLIKLNKFSLP